MDNDTPPVWPVPNSIHHHNSSVLRTHVLKCANRRHRHPARPNKTWHREPSNRPIPALLVSSDPPRASSVLAYKTHQGRNRWT
jgi:hypothetical protein